MMKRFFPRYLGIVLMLGLFFLNSRADAKFDFKSWFESSSARQKIITPSAKLSARSDRVIRFDPSAAHPPIVSDTVSDAIRNVTATLVGCSEPSDFWESASVVGFSVGPRNSCVGTVHVASGDNAGDHTVSFQSYQSTDDPLAGDGVDYSELAPISVSVACDVLREAYLKGLPVHLGGKASHCSLPLRNFVSADYVGVGQFPAYWDVPHALGGLARDAQVDETGTVTNFGVYSNQAHVNCTAEINSPNGHFEAFGSPFMDYYDAADAQTKHQYAQWSMNMCSSMLSAYAEGRTLQVKALVYNPENPFLAQVNAKMVGLH